jgi:transcriptional regulator with XRE-family HTH domain
VVVNGKNLAAIRQQLNLGQHHVAEGIGRSATWVSLVERGLLGSPKDIERVAAFLRAHAQRVESVPMRNAAPSKNHGATA